MKFKFNVFTGTLDMVETTAGAPDLGADAFTTEAADRLLTEAGDYLVPEEA
jgi:hypothetical protein